MNKMDWSKLLNYKDFKPDRKSEKYKFNLSRTPFQKDYDRIIFSEDFRRLDKKTQVHPLKINDHVHARLSHSLETSSVGRSLGSLIGNELIKLGDFHPYPEIVSNKKNSDIVLPIITGQIIQAACLAHDIGNPPFGHAGEELIQDWFKERKEFEIFSELEEYEMNDFINFEGNAQAFRVLTRTSMRRDQGGMGLTYAVLCSMMKYPWVYSEKLPINKRKFCCFFSEKDYLQQIAEECGLIPNQVSESSYSFSRHPFAFLSEASDDICYNIMDLEDAYELKILDFNTVYNVFIKLCSQYDGFDFTQYKSGNDKNMLSHMRAIAIDQCILSVVNEFMDRYDDILTGAISPTYSLVRNCDGHISEVIEEAKQISETRVFTSERKAMLEIAANQALTTLLYNFCSAVFQMHTKTYDSCSGYSKKIIDLMGSNKPDTSDSLYNKYQKVVDHISGMTDNYAIRLAKNMNGIIE